MMFILANPRPASADELKVEAESARFRGGYVEEKSAASGGKVLGGGWGAAMDHFAELEFRLDAPLDARLALRYAFDQEQFLRRFPGSAVPHSVSLTIDGREVTKELDLPDTADWNVFSNAVVPLGKLAAGPHTLRLTPAHPASDLNLDQITVGGADFQPDTRAAVLWPTHSRHFRIRLSPRVDSAAFPARQVFTNLEAQYAFHYDWLGFEQKEQGLLTVMAAADWNAGNSTAYTNQGLIYLQEREILHPGDNYAHEMFHMFESGMDYPTWWSEGMAFLVSVRSDAEIYGRPHEDIDSQIQSLRDWWTQEGRSKMLPEDGNRVALWGSDREQTGVGSRDLYRTANLMVYSLWLQEGDGLFKRIYALINADRAAGKYAIPAAPFEKKNRLLLDYVLRATGPERRDPVRRFWAEWKMPLTPTD
jgi:hypothetical protein